MSYLEMEDNFVGISLNLDDISHFGLSPPTTHSHFDSIATVPKPSKSMLESLAKEDTFENAPTSFHPGFVSQVKNLVDEHGQFELQMASVTLTSSPQIIGYDASDHDLHPLLITNDLLRREPCDHEVSILVAKEIINGRSLTGNDLVDSMLRKGLAKHAAVYHEVSEFRTEGGEEMFFPDR
jgi:hypothetical protein